MYGVKTGFTHSTDQSDNLLSCLVYECKVKDEWKVTWHVPNGMLLDVSVSHKNKTKKTVVLIRLLTTDTIIFQT